MKYTKYKNIYTIQKKIPGFSPDRTTYKVHSKSSYTQDGDNLLCKVFTFNLDQLTSTRR